MAKRLAKVAWQTSRIRLHRGDSYRRSDNHLRYGVVMRCVRCVIAALLVAATLPAMQPVWSDSSDVLAVASEGTTDYAKIFAIGNLRGTPGKVTGATLTAASTENDSMYGCTGSEQNYTWQSSAAFYSNESLSLKHDWEIRITASLPPASSLPAAQSWMRVSAGVALGASDTYAKFDGIKIFMTHDNNSGINDYSLEASDYQNSIIVNTIKRFSISDWSDNTPYVATYSYASNTLTLTAQGESLVVDNVRGRVGQDVAHFGVQGNIQWRNKANLSVAQIPNTYRMLLTFQSISIPHLDPDILSVKLFDPSTGLEVGATDPVMAGKVLKVECKVGNTNAQAGAEEFSMHLKLANSAAWPTSGLMPVYDAVHPVQVDGVTVAIDSGKNTPTDPMGVPLTLAGSSPATVTYYVKVSEGGAAAVLSQELVEDSFQGSHFDTTTLLAERLLKPAPATPGDSTKPGSDYHFTRLPQANENGWNNSAVTVQFFGGDYDSFMVTPANGDAPTMLTDKKTWVRSSDTDGYDIELQAKNATSNLVSITKTDTVKIDSAAPRLSVDPALGVLIVDDSSSDGSHAVSGVWRLYRTDASGAVAALARAAADRVFPLTDGVGKPTQSAANLPDGYYVAEDAAGNVSAPVPVGDVSGGGAAGSGSDDPVGPQPPTVTPVTSDNPSGGKPLEPTKVTVNEETGTANALVEDVMTVSTAPIMLTADKASALLLNRYKISSAAGGQAAWGTPQLFNADGKPVDAIDQAIPGDWYIEMQAKDEAGNTTTLRVRYQVRGSGVSGAMTGVPSDDGNDAPSGDKGVSGSGNGDGKGGLGTVLTKLPQTGALLGECPLHGMFLLLMVLVSAYSMMRLRQESCREKEERYDACR